MVDPDIAMFDAQMIAGKGDDPLDVALLWIARIVKDHHIATLDGLNAVDKLVDEEPVVVFQPGQHAGSLYPHRLVEKDDDQHRGHSRDGQIAQP